MSIVKFRNQFPLFLNHFFENDLFDSFNQNYSSTNTSVPSVNIKETKEGFEVEVAAPSYNREDFKIEIENDILNISSEKEETKTEEAEKENKFTRKEFSFQSFKRSFSLPNTIDRNRVSAKYENGILKISIPKKEEKKNTKCKKN